jgi:hypothetical protein
MQQLKYPVYFKPRYIEQFKTQIVLDGVKYQHSRTQQYIDRPNKSYYQCHESSTCGRIIYTKGYDDFKLTIPHQYCKQRCPTGHRVNNIKVFQILDIKANIHLDQPKELNEGIKLPAWEPCSHNVTLLFCDKTDREVYLRIYDCRYNTVGEVIRAIAQKYIVVKGGIDYNLKNFIVTTLDGSSVYDYFQMS